MGGMWVHGQLLLDMPCWLPSFEVSVVEPLAHCTTVTQSGLCSECHNKYVFLSCPSLCCDTVVYALSGDEHSQRRPCGSFWEELEHLKDQPPNSTGGPAGMCWWPAHPMRWLPNSSPIYISFLGEKNQSLYYSKSIELGT